MDPRHGKEPMPAPANPLSVRESAIQVCVRSIDLAQHEISVELRIPASRLEVATAAYLPVWTPGSYLVRDYARCLDRVRLQDAGGQEIQIIKTGTSRWEIPPLPKGGTLSYRLFCNELTVRTNHVDREHAQVVGAASFLALEGQEDAPYEIRFEGWPADWKIASALPETDGVFAAQDFDTLVDSPFELGAFRREAWVQDGAVFELVVGGEHNGDEARILSGTKAIVEACGRLFGGFPFERYVFLLVFRPDERGGLEHRDSTSLLADSHALGRPEGYYDLFTLIAHEFFHAWNVKRLRAPELGPFDYGRENPTRMLWFHEGFTSFIQYGLVLQAGVAPWSWVVRRLASIWTEYTTRAGRREQSLEEASFDAWIRHYKPTAFSANSTVSYYDKGAAIAWMMDAQIRLASGGAHGLDHFFCTLWRRLGDASVSDGDLRELYRELTGRDPQAFWNDYLQGCAELDSREICQAYGLRFDKLAPWEAISREDARDPAVVERMRGYTGLAWSGPQPEIRHVEPGSPAARAGLSFGHEILAVNGWRTATAAEAQQRLQDIPVGGHAEVLASNRGRVFQCELDICESPLRSTRIQTLPAPSEEQRAAFQAWTHQPFPLPRRGTL